MISTFFSNFLSASPSNQPSEQSSQDDYCCSYSYSCSDPSFDSRCLTAAIGNVSTSSKYPDLHLDLDGRQCGGLIDATQSTYPATVQPLQRTLTECLITVLSRYTLEPIAGLLAPINLSLAPNDIGRYLSWRDPLVFPGATAESAPGLQATRRCPDALQKSNDYVSRLLKKTHMLFIPGDSLIARRELVELSMGLIANNTTEQANLARQIQKGAGLYGAHATETLSAAAQLEIIERWVAANYFNGQVDDFLMAKLASNDLRRELTVADALQFFRDEIDDAMAPAAKQGIWQIVDHALPILGYLRALDGDQQRMPYYATLQLHGFEWGAIHAGLQFSRQLGMSSKDISLEQAAAVGKMLLAQLNEGAAPEPWHHFFRLPALLRYAIAGHSPQEMAVFSVLDYVQAYERFLEKTCPASKFKVAMQQFKTRPRLQQEIAAQQCGGRSIFLYLGFASLERMFCPDTGRMFRFSDLDYRYRKQVEQIADAYQDLNHLLMRVGWGKLPDAEIDFLKAANVRRAEASFSSAHLLNNVILGANAAARRALTYDLAPGIELISAQARRPGTKQTEERIYAMQKDESGYQIHRVDRERSAYYDLVALIDQERVQQPNFKLNIVALRDGLVKRADQDWKSLIDYLARRHRDVFFKQLYDYGFEETTMEKITDFFLSLVPFYTCVTAINEGHAGEAAVACGIDIISFIPLLGNLSALSIKFGQELATGGLHVIENATAEVAARRTLNSVLKRAGGDFMRYAMLPASRVIGRQELKVLHTGLLQAVDPGFELVGSVSRASLGQALRLGNYLKESLPALKDILPELDLAWKKMPQNLPLDTYLTGQVRGMDKAVPVIKLGGDVVSGNRAVFIKINPDTGEAYGRKYVLAEDGRLDPIPLTLARRLKNIQVQGLGGGGAPLQAKHWRREGASNAMVSPSLLQELLQWGEASIRQVGGWETLSRIYGLPLPSIRQYLGEDGRLTEAGRDLLNQDQAAPAGAPLAELSKLEQAVTPPALTTSAGTSAQRIPDLKDFAEWATMTASRRHMMSKKRFAISRNLNPNTWGALVELTGEPTVLAQVRYGIGQQDLFRQPVIDDLRDWRAMTIRQRKALTAKAFALQRGIYPARWHRLVKIDGTLTSVGRNWFSNLGAPDSSRLRDYLTKTVPSNPSASAMDDAVLPPQAAPGESNALVSAPLPVSAPPPVAAFHQDDSPALPDTPLREPDGIAASVANALQDVDWRWLDGFLKDLPVRKRLSIKENILEQARNWLIPGGDHIANFDNLIYPRARADASRGANGLYARQALARFTVLGPYAGRVLYSDRPEQMIAAEFRIAAAAEEPGTSMALNSGNVGNVGVMRLSNDLPFFVTLHDVMADDELLICTIALSASQRAGH